MKSHNKLVVSVVLVAAILCVPSASVAANVWHASTVKGLYPLADGTFIIILNTDTLDCRSPNNPKYYYVAPGQNAMTVEGAKKVYAAAALAMALNKSVQIYFDNVAASCYINAMVVVN